MGLIYRDIKLYGRKNECKVKALFDTGSSESFIRKDIAEKIGTLSEMPRPKTQYVIFPDIILDGHELFWTLVVVDGLTEEVILGADFFQRWKMKLDPETEKIIWDPVALKLKLV